MAIPTFQTVMRPLLELAADGKEVRSGEAVEALADRFGLTPEERDERLPSGRQRRFNNRVAWALAYFRATPMMDATGRGRYVITDRGREESPAGSQSTSSTSPSSRNYRRSGPDRSVQARGKGEPTRDDFGNAGPDASRHIRLSRPNSKQNCWRRGRSRPFLFEKVVLDLLVAMNYGGSRDGAGRRTSRTGDEGIDGIINEDPLGLDVVCIQAKRWTTKTVSRPDVQMFSGSLDGKSSKGVFITTSTFSDGATEYASQLTGKKIILINGMELARLMIEHDIGVSVSATYVTKRIDLDYFEGE